MKEHSNNHQDNIDEGRKSPYIDGILVDEIVVTVEEVVGYLERFELTSKLLQFLWKWCCIRAKLKKTNQKNWYFEEETMFCE